MADTRPTKSEFEAQEHLKSLEAATSKIVFTKHYNIGGSHYAYTEGLSDAQDERHFIPGTALCVMTIKGSEAQVSTRHAGCAVYSWRPGPFLGTFLFSSVNSERAFSTSSRDFS